MPGGWFAMHRDWYWQGERQWDVCVLWEGKHAIRDSFRQHYIGMNRFIFNVFGEDVQHWRVIKEIEEAVWVLCV